MSNTIGLFGTCGNSTWRNGFIEEYNARGIDFFNPQVDDWSPELAEVENQHLREDNIILFPVLAETGGTGSLGEIGFSVFNIVNNLNNGSDQTLIVMIDDECTMDDEAIAKESNRTRKLVKSKLADIKHPNVYLVNTLDEMYELSLKIRELYAMKQNISESLKAA